MTDDRTIIAATELAERLIDEVTRAAHDWRTVEHLADALARLAATAGDGPATDRSPTAAAARRRRAGATG